MREFTSHHVEDMRALRSQGMSWKSVKAFFRDEDFTDDDTVTLIWKTASAKTLLEIRDAVIETNRINKKRRGLV